MVAVSLVGNFFETYIIGDHKLLVIEF